MPAIEEYSSSQLPSMVIQEKAWRSFQTQSTWTI